MKALKLYNTEKTNSKNVNRASTTSGSQNETVQLLAIINFIQDIQDFKHDYFIKLQLAINPFKTEAVII